MTIFFVYHALLVALSVSYVQVSQRALASRQPSLAPPSSTPLSTHAGLTASILMYRAFFHRLLNFPNPSLTKLSRFFAMSKAAKNLQAMK
jgi:hypothetical protein